MNNESTSQNGLQSSEQSKQLIELRKELESLRLENARAKLLETTLASIDDAVIATDTSGLITLMNAGAESLTGWDAGNAFGRSLESVFTVICEQTGKPMLDLARLGVSDPGKTFGALLIATGSRERMIEFSVSPIREKQGRVRETSMCFGTSLCVGSRRKPWRSERSSLRLDGT